MATSPRLRALVLAWAVFFGASPLAARTIDVLANERKPFFYSEGGKPAGFEYDILVYWAKAAGHELRVRWAGSWEEILPQLEQGAADVAAGTFTVTPERTRKFDFTSSYFPVRVLIVQPRSRPAAGLEQLAGARLATIRGTTYHQLLGAVPGARLVFATTIREVFSLVASGQADAAAADSAVALSLISEFPALTTGKAISAEQQLGFAVRKGSPLAGEISSHLALLRSSGIYFRLLERHFGAEAVHLVTSARSTDPE